MAHIGWLSFGSEDISDELSKIKENQNRFKQDLHEIKCNLDTALQLLRIIVAQVQIAQEDLDGVGSSLEALVEVVRQIDTTKLPDADKTALLNGVTDLTSAINEKLSPSTPVEAPVESDVDL